ncbi:MAG TPA: TldD/PmbA family protein [Thermoplasmata archaeon]|nr:TldD/PmbA family protein [Thermoplasmata archaeon]
MEDLLRVALAAAGRSSAIVYADARVIAPYRYEHLAVRNGAASSLTSTTRAAVGVRVRTRKAWGFAAATGVARSDARAVAAQAVALARAADRSAPGDLPVTDERGPDHGTYRSPVGEDPFALSVEQKLELLTEAERALHAGPEVKSGLATFQAWSEEKWFASSEGSSYRSTIVHVGAGVDATAVGGGEVQRRSAPTSFGGDFRQAGFEFIRTLDLPEVAARTGREAVELLTAPACPTATTTIVLASDQCALQVHESVGHATELDRISGMEAGYAGTSFLAPTDLGRLRYGSRQMQIVADATEPGGLGTFGWDDEGIEARRRPLVTDGVLSGFLTSRETAARIGEARSGGTVRAEGALRLPLIRMTNIDLQPGDHTFDELLEGVTDGVFFLTNRSWSIDDKRLNFQFGTQVGRRIEHGSLGALVRNPIYSGSTPEFWASMDAVGDRSTWHLWGVPNCGKGQPSQVARVGHGAPAARFRDVRVRGG